MNPKTVFHFITLFPEVIEKWLTTSIIGKAHARGIFDFKTYQLRDYSTSTHRSVDDRAYGGGGGMVLSIEPLVLAVEAIQKGLQDKRGRVLYFSPKGHTLNQEYISSTLKERYTDYILICGHYEGIDQRFIDGWVDEEISIGDFVVSGGEIPALLFSDAIIRHLEGTLKSEEHVKNESFSIEDPISKEKLLEHPHYTRPKIFREREVPEILLQGDHSLTAEWRLRQSREITESRKKSHKN
jgi:tRNA (guanine37-N1)-methyltransferase